MEELDLKELFNVFWDKKTEIIMILVTFIILGAMYSFFAITPKYTSSTTMLLVQTGGTEEGDATSITQTDITLNSKLVATYSDLIKSKTVLNEVVNNLGHTELTRKEIKDSIKVSSKDDTEIIEISVTNKNAEYAAEIANEVAKVFSARIVDIYNISNVYIVDKAEVSDTPSNINHTKDIVIFAFIGIVIGAVYVLICNMLDNTIKTEEDVEKVTELLVLASIPDYQQNNKGGRK